MKKAKGGSQYLTYGKTHYQRNKQAYIDKARERLKSNIEYVRDIKRVSVCVDCGNNDWRVLDFDHSDSGTKVGNIGDPKILCLSREKIDAEIAKCEVVCSNCHRIRTYERRQASEL